MRNLDTQEVKFGTGCSGEMTFWGDEEVEVVLRGVPGWGRVEVLGSRRAGGAREGLVGDLSGEWAGFRREAYGYGR